jgi:hypothetical protein
MAPPNSHPRHPVLDFGVPMPGTRSLAAALLAALALGLPAARAENASAPLLPGDRLHGNILTPGDGDLLTLYLPSGTSSPGSSPPTPPTRSWTSPPSPSPAPGGSA